MEHSLHFIGIGGIGMSAIAKIMLHNGFAISGSDVAEGRLTRELAADGARISYGHAAENIPADAEAVVYSSAVKADNVEMQAAQARGLKVYRRAEMLAYLMSQKDGIGVAGAHGKTTTSAMIATMLECCGCDPTVVIGGMLPVIGGNAKAGESSILVAEADESDGTFLLLLPKIAVVTNIEADHLDYYHDLETIIDAFAQYLRQIPKDGLAVVCNDCPTLRELCREIPGRYISYGLRDGSDYQAKELRHSPEGVSADVYYQEKFLGRLQLQVAGAHNICNALSAIAIGRELGLSFSQCAEGLRRFTGTGRRYELLAERDGFRLVDDYAHHPTEIAATIQTARAQGVKKMLAVFQPHRYSRTQEMYKEFAAALFGADRVLLCELYPAFEQPIPGVSAQLVVDELKRLGHKNVAYAANLENAYSFLQNELRDEDLLLVMGAGNVRSLSERYAAYIKEK